MTFHDHIKYQMENRNDGTRLMPMNSRDVLKSGLGERKQVWKDSWETKQIQYFIVTPLVSCWFSLESHWWDHSCSSPSMMPGTLAAGCCRAWQGHVAGNEPLRPWGKGNCCKEATAEGYNCGDGGNIWKTMEKSMTNPWASKNWWDWDFWSYKWEIHEYATYKLANMMIETILLGKVSYIYILILIYIYIYEPISWHDNVKE